MKSNYGFSSRLFTTKEQHSSSFKHCRCQTQPVGEIAGSQLHFLPHRQPQANLRMDPIERSIDSDDERICLPIIKENSLKAKKRRKCKLKQFDTCENEGRSQRKMKLLKSVDRYSDFLKESTIKTPPKLKIAAISINSKTEIIPKRSKEISSNRQYSFNQCFEKKMANIRLAKKLITIQPTHEFNRQNLRRFYDRHLSHLKILEHRYESPLDFSSNSQRMP